MIAKKLLSNRRENESLDNRRLATIIFVFDFNSFECGLLEEVKLLSAKELKAIHGVI